jgi:ATP-dependent Clp protease ATP-binding subunit ClpC
VILFDEIEKAHPEVWNALLQILDDGRLTDGQGRVVDFRNTVLIMTSNLGTEYVTKGGTLGFLGSSGEGDQANQEKIEKALKNAFRPEFLNRIDEIILFSPLSKENMKKIVTLQMEDIRSRLAEHDLKVELTEVAVDWLANEGYDSAFGARPLKRALQKHVESPLSISMLSGEFTAGDTVVVDIEENEVVFTKKEAVEVSKTDNAVVSG